MLEAHPVITDAGRREWLAGHVMRQRGTDLIFVFALGFSGGLFVGHIGGDRDLSRFGQIDDGLAGAEGRGWRVGDERAQAVCQDEGPAP